MLNELIEVCLESSRQWAMKFIKCHHFPSNRQEAVPRFLTSICNLNSNVFENSTLVEEPSQFFPACLRSTLSLKEGKKKDVPTCLKSYYSALLQVVKQNKKNLFEYNKETTEKDLFLSEILVARYF